MVISRPIHLARINACARLSSIKLQVICLAKTFFFFPINFAAKPGNCPVKITQEEQCKNHKVFKTSSHYFRRLQERLPWINFSVNRLKQGQKSQLYRIIFIKNVYSKHLKESQTQQPNHLINNVQKYISTAWIQWKTRQNNPRNV